MRGLVVGLLMVAAPLSFAAGIQSRFYGPTSLTVWQHWQPSWNVELASPIYTFELSRSDNDTVILYLYSQGNRADLRGKLRCESWVRNGQWEVIKKTGEERVVTGRVEAEHGGITFRWEEAAECLDRAGKNITRKISVLVEDKESKEVFKYDFLPMYARGPKANYWDNPIPAFSAHGGKGEISVSTLLAGEKQWDEWNGTIVKPVLNFVDRNTMKSGAYIGMHRHEANQEAYLVESGRAEMLMGVATRAGENREAEHVWDENGLKKSTQEFSARGGWIESRRLTAGEIAVIVPNPEHKDTVYFHGLSADTDLVFWTMGSRN